jgi:nucleotide-binding universal stress UspA family protein
MFHKILVATGGSPWSHQAVAYAIEMAKDYTLPLVILHVVTETPPYVIAEASTPPESLLADHEAAGHRILAQAAARATEAGIAFSTALMWGRIPEVVCRMATEQACDLIIVGSRALRGFKRLMIGSISNAIASKAPCPVLIVKWREPS